MTQFQDQSADEEIVRRIQSGEIELFDILFERYEKNFTLCQNLKS
ncbi:MAG TPA: hypothetical protein P5570_01935 [Candidatus Paceibacterota bacterium]|nr:hypothetical protein [Candidatus Paceibacterota bacterium]